MLGKRVGDYLYFHVDSLPHFDEEFRKHCQAAATLVGITLGIHAHVIRIEANSKSSVALLAYPDFFDDPFPALQESWLIDLEAGTVRHRSYVQSDNPPILHRKELLLPPDHPRRAEFAALTQMAEAIGLFDDPKRIGYRKQWLALIEAKDYRIQGHTLVPVGNCEQEDDAGTKESSELHLSTAAWQTQRHRTALVRYGFSAPIQSLARHGFLDGTWTLLDYGCGRGDDVRGLRENGIEAWGWDPYYAPDEPLQPADIINLGFVINVIENIDERAETLRRAFSLAQRLLVVSVMLADQNTGGQPFRDGILTARGTFQKYYTQREIRDFIEQVLGESPIPVAPGVLYIFRDQDAEQRFLVNRYRRQSLALRQPSPLLRKPPSKRSRQERKYLEYQDPLDRLWERWCQLGRKPHPDEVTDLDVLRKGFGSLGRALGFLARYRDLEEIEKARHARIEDLTVYFALSQFEGRKPYRHLEPTLKRDIKAFFGSHTAALEAGKTLLFQIADSELILKACRQAAGQGLGWLEENRYLQLHTSLVERLPPILRVYVGCAAALYGDVTHADLVKIHIQSGKLTLMRFDDFEGKALPRMIERIKIKLRDQDIDFFTYGDAYPAPFLYHKSRYINEAFPHYPEQVAFEGHLDSLGLFDFSGYGPPPDRFLQVLEENRWQIEGFHLKRSATIPPLDAPCGRYLTFRDLIECGETWRQTRIDNRPKQPESYNALHDLAIHVLDPLIDYFGMIRLTFGFCSPALARKIPGRIDRKRDQHAAWERNRLGNLICPRLGAAVDFVVEDESMLEVAKWIVANTPFDRLYFYGDDRPIHVSYGPEHSRRVIWMRCTAFGKILPQRVSSLESLG